MKTERGANRSGVDDRGGQNAKLFKKTARIQKKEKERDRLGEIWDSEAPPWTEGKEKGGGSNVGLWPNRAREAKKPRRVS